MIVGTVFQGTDVKSRIYYKDLKSKDSAVVKLLDDFDAAYAEAFKLAMAAGVEALAYRCRLSPEEITVDKAVRVTR